MSSRSKLSVSATMVDALRFFAGRKSLHKAMARARKTKNRDGWTYRSHFVKQSTVAALHRRHLVSSCCAELHGADLLRISMLGEAVLASYA